MQRCVLAVVDCSGFTRLTETLAQYQGGAEDLCSILNDFFTQIIEVAHVRARNQKRVG